MWRRLYNDYKKRSVGLIEYSKNRKKARFSCSFSVRGRSNKWKQVYIFGKKPLVKWPTRYFWASEIGGICTNMSVILEQLIILKGESLLLNMLIVWFKMSCGGEESGVINQIYVKLMLSQLSGSNHTHNYSNVKTAAADPLSNKINVFRLRAQSWKNQEVVLSVRWHL